MSSLSKECEARLLLAERIVAEWIVRLIRRRDDAKKTADRDRKVLATLAFLLSQVEYMIGGLVHK